MRKLFMLTAVMFCSLFFPVSAAIADDAVQFDLKRIYYKDSLREVSYNFSDSHSTEEQGEITNVIIDADGYDAFVTYNDPVGNYNDNYGLNLRFQYISADQDLPNVSISFDKDDKKAATYSFPKTSKKVGDPGRVTDGFPINFTTNGNHAKPAVNEWFYSTRIENFRGFTDNSFSEFVFSVLPPSGVENRPDLPAFLVSAKWIKGLYKGKKFNNTLVLSALARRYGEEPGQDQNDPGAHGDIIWESEVGAHNPAAEISTNSIVPENAILDIGVDVSESGAGSDVKLYYRLFDKTGGNAPDGMSSDSQGWKKFHTIYIPGVEKGNDEIVKFPGLPRTLASYSVHSETLAFDTETTGSGNITGIGNEAIDRTGLAALGALGAEPISTKESFTLDGITAGQTVVLQYGLSGKALTDSQSKAIRLADVRMKKIFPNQNTPVDFDYNKYFNSMNPTDGQWCLVNLDSQNNTPLDPSAIINQYSNDKYYVVCFAIKDGGKFDSDGKTDGKITDPNILVLPDSPPSDGPGEDNADDTSGDDSPAAGDSATTTVAVPNGNVTVPSDVDINETTGVATLPTGGEITLADGETAVIVPPSTTIDPSTGAITVTQGGAVTLPASDVPDGAGIEFLVPPGTTIDSATGTVSVASSAGALTLPGPDGKTGADNDIKIIVPGGTTIDPATGQATAARGGRIVLPGSNKSLETTQYIYMRRGAVQGDDLEYHVTSGTTVDPYTGVVSVTNGGDITLPDGSTRTVAPGTSIDPFDKDKIEEPDTDDKKNDPGTEESTGGCATGSMMLASMAAAAFMTGKRRKA